VIPAKSLAEDRNPEYGRKDRDKVDEHPRARRADQADSLDKKELIQKRKKKYSKQIKKQLEDAEELFTKLKKDFQSQFEKLEPFLNYLDTEERKLIEMIQLRIKVYENLLMEFYKKSEFNI